MKAIDPGMAKGKAKELLDTVVNKYGGAPNSFKMMAHSPAGLQGFLGLSGTLEGGVLPFETRYQIAIAVSEINGCPYCLSAFTAIGKGSGMKDETLAMCRRAGSTDSKIDAMLKFAVTTVRERRAVTPAEGDMTLFGVTPSPWSTLAFSFRCDKDFAARESLSMNSSTALRSSSAFGSGSVDSRSRQDGARLKHLPSRSDIGVIPCGDDIPPVSIGLRSARRCVFSSRHCSGAVANIGKNVSSV